MIAAASASVRMESAGRSTRTANSIVASMTKARVEADEAPEIIR